MTKIEIVCPHCGVPITVDPETLQAKPPKIQAIPYIETWNAFAKQHSLPLVRETNQPILKALNTRLTEKGFAEDFGDALKTIERESFWRGQNERQWKITLAFLVRPGKAEELAQRHRLELERHATGNGKNPGADPRLLSRTRGDEPI